MSNLAYRPDIDGLRSLAVLPVVFNHAGFSAFPGDFIGVDIFFVISGFLITNILVRELEEQQFSIVGFYERRARRILPALVTVILACLVAGWFILLPDEYARLGKSAVATLLFSSNVWFRQAAGDYFGADVVFEPLLHTWSLAVEEQFYIAFPLLLWLLAKGPRKYWLVAIGALSLLSLALSVWATSADPVGNFYLVPTRAWELGLGALLALGAVPRVKAAWAAHLIGLAGLVAIFASIALIDDASPFPGLAALPPCLGAAAIIWAGMDRQNAAGRLLSVGPLVGIGLISYSLYLWHWPILVVGRMIHGNTALPSGLAIGCIVLATVLAIISWRIVEQPFRRADSGLRFTRKQVFSASAAAMGCLGLLSAGIIALHGFPARVATDDLFAYKTAVKRASLDDACMGRKPNDPPCRLGQTELPTTNYVIWGNSHAGALLPGFDLWLKANGAQGAAFTKGACAPLPGLWRVDQGLKHRCDAHNQRVLETVVTQFPKSTVVLAARWALMTEGTRMDGEAGGPALLARTGDSSASIPGNAALVEEGLDRLVGELTRRGHRVILLGGVPEPGFDVARAIARSALIGSAIPATPRSGYEARNHRADAILGQVATRHGATVVSVADTMCVPDCAVTNAAGPLYRDDDHLSIAGARLIIPQVMDRATAAQP